MVLESAVSIAGAPYLSPHLGFMENIVDISHLAPHTRYVCRLGEPNDLDAAIFDNITNQVQTNIYVPLPSRYTKHVDLAILFAAVSPSFDRNVASIRHDISSCLPTCRLLRPRQCYFLCTHFDKWSNSYTSFHGNVAYCTGDY